MEPLPYMLIYNAHLQKSIIPLYKFAVKQIRGPGVEPLSRFKGVEGGESKLPRRFATFAIKSRPVRQDI